MAGPLALIPVALVLMSRGVTMAMTLERARKAGHTILSVINVSKKALQKAGGTSTSLFRINTGKNAGQLNSRAQKGMNHADVNQTAATQFSGNIVTGRTTLSLEKQRGIRDYLRGDLSKSGLKKLLGAGTFASVLPFLGDEDAEYIDPRIPRPEDRQALIDAELGLKPSAPTSQQEFAEQIRAGYREQYQREVDRQQLDPNEQAPKRFIPTEFRQRVAEDVPWDYRRKAPGISAGYPDLTRSTPEGEKIYQDRMRQKMQNWYGRLTAEKEAIAAADPSTPRFTSAELSPYKKVAEPGFGQKLFGLRRSAPEIERDVTYTDLKMQGLDKEADKYWSDWNAENKAKKDAALGEGKSLTEYTKDDADRENSFAENIASAAKEFSTVVKEKLPTKKKGGGRVSSRPKSYRTAKIMKKYAKGGSVRKPKRI